MEWATVEELKIKGGDGLDKTLYERMKFLIKE